MFFAGRLKPPLDPGKDQSAFKHALSLTETDSDTKIVFTSNSPAANSWCSGSATECGLGAVFVT